MFRPAPLSRSTVSSAVGADARRTARRAPSPVDDRRACAPPTRSLRLPRLCPFRRALRPTSDVLCHGRSPELQLAGISDGWLGRQDSNLQSAAPKAAALPFGYAPDIRSPARRAAPRVVHVVAGAVRDHPRPRAPARRAACCALGPDSGAAASSGEDRRYIGRPAARQARLRGAPVASSSTPHLRDLRDTGETAAGSRSFTTSARSRGLESGPVRPRDARLLPQGRGARGG